MCSCLEPGPQQRTKAEEACKKALAGCPGRPTAVLQLARLLHGSEKHQEALNTLEQGLHHLSATTHQCADPQLNLVSPLLDAAYAVVLVAHCSCLLFGIRLWLVDWLSLCNWDA